MSGISFMRSNKRDGWTDCCAEGTWNLQLSFCVLCATHQTLGKPEHYSICKYWIMLFKYIPPLQSKHLFGQRVVPFRGVKVENRVKLHWLSGGSYVFQFLST